MDCNKLDNVTYEGGSDCDKNNKVSEILDDKRHVVDDEEGGSDCNKNNKVSGLLDNKQDVDVGGSHCNKNNEISELLDNKQDVDDEDDEDIKKLYNIKYHADYLFSIHNYEQSLQYYQEVINELNELQMTFSLLQHQEYQELLVLSHLNASCCFLKIYEFKKCIDICNKLLSLSLSYATDVFNEEKHAR